MHIKEGNVLLEPAVPCNKLLLTVYFSINSVPDTLLLNKIGEGRMSCCYCKLAWLQVKSLPSDLEEGTEWVRDLLWLSLWCKTLPVDFLQKRDFKAFHCKNFSPTKSWIFSNTGLVLSILPSRNIRVHQDGGDPVPGSQKIPAGWRTASSTAERSAIARARMWPHMSYPGFSSSPPQPYLLRCPVLK